MQIFGQVWLWSLGSFLLGALFTWLLLVRPMRQRLIELEDTRHDPMPSAPTRIVELAHASAPALPPSGPGRGPTDTDRSLDDLFDNRKPKSAVPPLPPLSAPAPPPPTPAPAAPRPAVAPQVATPPPLPSREPQSIQSRLDSGPTAPPEPPMQPPTQDDTDTELSDNPFQRFTESTTVFVPPANLPVVPPEIQPTGEDWFSKEDEADPHLITDVDDDEVVDEGGTIFTQHTTPIPAGMIRSLDESEPQPTREEPEQEPAELTQVVMPPVTQEPSRHELAEDDDYDDDPDQVRDQVDQYQPAHQHQPVSHHQDVQDQELAGDYEVSDYVVEEYEQQPAPAEYQPAPAEYQPAYAAQHEPEHAVGRSLFEPVVPVPAHEESDEDDGVVAPGPFGPGSAMPLPGGGSPAPEFNVKASVTALRYCTQDNPQFDRIVAEVWFRSPSDAERVGFRVLS
jgi:hypothetical protein